MALHLTSDNHKTAQLGDKVNHLAAVSYNSANHLVCIRQTTAWSSKVMVQRPDAGRWCACMATGVEAYPSAQGGSNVYADTLNLVNAVGTLQDSKSWRTGYHPCWSYFARNVRGPYAKVAALPNNSAEFGQCAVAYRYNLHRLHFSRLSSWSVKLRVYCPSFLLEHALTAAINACRVPKRGETLPNSAANLNVYVSKSLPTFAADVADGHDSFSFANGIANNGTNPTSETGYTNHSVSYTPIHDGSDIFAVPVWTANSRTQSASTTKPTVYYRDFQLADRDNLDVFGLNPARVWVTCAFQRANGFAGTQSGDGLAGSTSAAVWFYRADLVVTATGSAIK